MSDAPAFAACAETGCPEHALSFADRCWTHTAQADYPRRLREGLRRLGGGRARLNLKKVCADGIDFSDLDIQDSGFSQTQLSNCNFIGCTLSQSDMIGARFLHCDFVGCQMRSVNMTRSVLTGCAFSHSDLSRSYLTESLFKELDFMGSNLWNVTLWSADLTGAQHLKKKNFQDPDADGSGGNARISETHALMACESYRGLKHYFYSKGLYEDSSWAAYKELTMEREDHRQKRDPRFFPSLLMDLLSGYTQRPDRVILSSLVIILSFGLIYYALNLPITTIADPASHIGFWDSLYFSFITFATVGYGDFVPQSNAWFRLLACVEGFTGPFMSGLYVFTLTRRYAAG